jgi:cold shock CspA family protein
MEAIVTHINVSHLIARCNRETIFVHQTAADFIVNECAKGDIIVIHAMEDTGRGPRARSASWLSRPEGPTLVEFAGEVVGVRTDRQFAFVKPDEETIDVFCHVTDFADYHGASETFNALSRGDRIRGYWFATSRGRRGQQLVAL